MFHNPSGSFIQLPESLSIQLVPPPSYSPIDQARMDSLFEKLCEDKPLFNGNLLCIQPSNLKSFQAYSLSYKEYVASQYLEEYPISHTPLAVSGWIIYQNCLLFGVRSDSVLFHPGELELVPSGGVDGSAVEANGEISFQKALIQEFEEETGLDALDIISIQTKALYLCREKNVFDICMSITLDPNKSYHLEGNPEEYSHLFWIPVPQLSSFLQMNREKMLPLSRLLIEQIILKESLHG